MLYAISSNRYWFLREKYYKVVKNLIYILTLPLFESFSIAQVLSKAHKNGSDMWLNSSQKIHDLMSSYYTNLRSADDPQTESTNWGYWILNFVARLPPYPFPTRINNSLDMQ